jgi:hypothetical protein
MNIDKDLNYETPQRPSIIENDTHSELISSAFHRGPSRRTGYKLTGFLLASVAADMLVITACTFLFLMGASAFLKMNGNSLLQTGFYLYGYISIIYFILLRIFLGATIGEWSCGIRIGQPFERMQSNYALKICSRVFLILITGVITLPLLSLVFKKDLAGKLTQASLYTLK